MALERKDVRYRPFADSGSARDCKGREGPPASVAQSASLAGL